MPVADNLDDGAERSTVEAVSRRGFVRRAVILGASAPIAMLVLQACGGDDEEEPSTTDVGDEAETTVADVTDEETTVVDEADEEATTVAGAGTEEPAGGTTVVVRVATPIGSSGTDGATPVVVGSPAAGATPVVVASPRGAATPVAEVVPTSAPLPSSPTT